MAAYLVELYAPRGSAPATDGLLRATATGVRHLQTIVLPVDETAYCVIEAPSTAAVAELVEAAGLEAERIIGVTLR
jgi:Protein of unknown function (DUF4242)